MSEKKAAKVSEKKVKIPKMDPGCDIAVIDIVEREIDPGVLKILLKDMTTGCNILWACDDYTQYGGSYRSGSEITYKSITLGRKTTIIQPRILKDKCYQKERTKSHAEVFTPSWICNDMNNLCDEAWFGRKNVFNVVNKDHTWTATTEPIFESGSDKWREYVKSKRIEITCGEAPYLVSPYDTTTGQPIPLEQRIGMLDRKFRVINENLNDEKLWWIWVVKAFKSIYGYEYQGDNLLLARENLLYTFIDNYKMKFGKDPDVKKQKAIAKIIVWNIWQMDGLKDSTPTGTIDNPDRNLFEQDETDTVRPVLCKIKDWDKNIVINFEDLKKDQQ